MINTIGNKDKTIRDFLTKLSNLIGNKAFDIVDHWNGDKFAIGIAKPSNHDVLVYIQTFGNQKGKYDVHLEIPSENKNKIPYIDAGRHSNVTFAQIVKIICNHFNFHNISKDNSKQSAINALKKKRATRQKIGRGKEH